MNMTYEDVIHLIESSGFYASLVEEEGDERIILGSRKERGFLRGSTFWLSLRYGHWYLATWAPRYYKIHDPDELLSICTEFLRNKQRASGSLPKQIMDSYSVEEVSEEAFRSGV
jgi:hypothetical protein